MKKLVSFFEIPATDFSRATKFCERVFNIKMEAIDCGHEKMAFFPKEGSVSPGAISWSSKVDFAPSKDGVLISLNCENMNDILKIIQESGGDVIIPKTKIEADGRGYFSTFIDSEGNRLGLYSDK